jgi:SAM-dependent methyltransferase
LFAAFFKQTTRRKELNKGQIPVVKPTEIEKKIWERTTPRKTGGLVRNAAFVFKDVLDWPDWYREPSKLDPEDWERKLLAGCRGEWFAHVLEGRNRVLDVGCGFGFPSFYLARYGHQVVGVDPSASEIATARAIAEKLGNPDNVRFEVIEQNNLPFADDSFDAATLCTSLECVGEPHVLLAELKRVLKPGSPVAIEEENRPVTHQPVTPNTNPVWEKTRWAFFDEEIWLWYELRITDPYLDRRYMLRIDPESEVATRLKEFELYIESKPKGLPTVSFDEAGISWDDALAAVVEPTFSEAKGYDGPSLKKLLESTGFTNIRFFLQPDGAEFARSLENQGLLALMPDNIRAVLRALVKSVPVTERGISTIVSASTPGGSDG